MAVALVPAASASIAPGALNCPLPHYNPNKYTLQGSPAQTVTCTIDGASDASGKSTIPVIVKSSDTGNTTVTGTVSGSGSSTKITFTFTAVSGGCNTVVVAYGSNGNNSNSSLIGGGSAAAGFAYVDSSGKLITTCGGTPPPPPPPPKIYLGYADSYTTHGTPDGLPWTGLSPAPFVLGCGVDPNGGGAIADICDKNPATGADLYDGGAILIVNPGTTPMTVTNAFVDIGPCHYTPWTGLNMSIPAGGSLVLTQTGGPHPLCGGGNLNGNYNFDTTESAPFGSSCSGPNDGLIPVVSLTINGTPMTIADTGQILNHGGVDVGDYPCFNSELTPFVQVSP